MTKPGNYPGNYLDFAEGLADFYLPGMGEELAGAIRAYGEQCRRAGAEAMLAQVEAAFAGWELAEGNRRHIRKALRALPLPSTAETASPAVGWRRELGVPDNMLTGTFGPDEIDDLHDHAESLANEGAHDLAGAVSEAACILEGLLFPAATAPSEEAMASPPTTERNARGG